jgi:energy-coupling factor transport system permease protein
VTRRLPIQVRLAVFLGASLALSVAQAPRVLLGAAGILGLLAWRQRLPRGMLRICAWVSLLPLPWMAVLFVLAGREATGTWSAGAAWGLARLAPYTARIGCLILANLLFLHATPLPELMGALRRLAIPERITLFLATLIRFLPSALQEARRVVEVQRCRGLERRRLLTPPGILALAVPLFLAQVQKSRDLALSLEIRGRASNRKP